MLLPVALLPGSISLCRLQQSCLVLRFREQLGDQPVARIAAFQVHLPESGCPPNMHAQLRTRLGILQDMRRIDRR